MIQQGTEAAGVIVSGSPARPSVEARPFLKWAGGKTQLLPELLPRIPVCFNRYLEPFLGGGALFFALAGNRRLARAYLSDANTRLVDAYRAVRDEVETVIAELGTFTNERCMYYEVRSQRHEELPPARRAARLIYLNKTCYNGLYRENQRGEFNVPFGRYKNPRICDADNLRAASAALQEAQIEAHDFDAILDVANRGDFVYLDPPYDPLSPTSSFTSYHENGFGEASQRRLAAAVRELDRAGVFVMLSNSNTSLVRSLYGGFFVEEVSAARAINSKADRRGKVTELIIRNYGSETGGRRD